MYINDCHIPITTEKQNVCKFKEICISKNVLKFQQIAIYFIVLNFSCSCYYYYEKSLS